MAGDARTPGEPEASLGGYACGRAGSRACGRSGGRDARWPDSRGAAGMQLGGADIENMIQRRQGERSWREKHECQTTFYVGNARGQDFHGGFLE